MAADRRIGPEFLASLAVGGVDGTLGRPFRRRGTPLDGFAERRGAWMGCTAWPASSMGGDGALYAFTFFVNDIAGSSRQARLAQDTFGELLLQMGAGDAPGGGAAAPPVANGVP